MNTSAVKQKPPVPRGRYTILPGLLLAGAIALIMVIVTYGSLSRDRARILDNTGRRLESIARATAAGIDGDRFAALFTPPTGSEKPGDREAWYFARRLRPEYVAVQAHIRRLIRSHADYNFTEENLYTFVAPREGEDFVRWAVIAHANPRRAADNAYPGKPYAVPEVMRSIFKSGASGIYTQVYLSTESNLRWMSGYAPIRDSRGRVVGIVDAAFKVERILAEVNEARDQMLSIIGLIFLAGGIAAFSVVRAAFRLDKGNKELRAEVKQRMEAQAELEFTAYHDPLTRLPNRVHFLLKLETRLTVHPDEPFAVVLLNMDRFKSVNDSLGYDFGDKLIRAVAERIASRLNSGDVLARVHGNEFGLLCTAPRERVLAHVEEIQSAVAAPFRVEGREIFTSVSAGIFTRDSGRTENGESSETFLRNAETAMYRAKGGGRGTTLAFNPDMHVQSVSLLQTEMELRRALQNNEFEVFYQPILSLRTERLVGFEALARWRHPERGLISPALFIPAAEETGLIGDIGNLVFRTACEQSARWVRGGHADLWVSVNFSARQFQGNLPEFIQSTLRDTKLETRNFKLEITETIAMSDIDHSTEILNEMSRLGIRICIDDFGTGYSSLAYLSRFPIHTLKIDKSFMDDLQLSEDPEHSERAAALINAMVALARNLDLDVIAEGVETPAQLRFLKENDCDHIQGYIISRPVEAAVVEQHLADKGFRTRAS